MKWRVSRPWGDSASTDGENPTADKIAYAYAAITRAQAGKALLSLGSADAIRAWVNGKPVLVRDGERAWSPDNDLIEVDLKRPGRVDVKVPLLPTSTPRESAQLIGLLARRYGLAITPADLERLEGTLPTCLTPGAAEALVVKAYRHSRTQDVSGGAALEASLAGYQNPVPPDVLEFQMRIAVREATDLNFVPPAFRAFAAAP